VGLELDSCFESMNYCYQEKNTTPAYLSNGGAIWRNIIELSGNVETIIVHKLNYDEPISLSNTVLYVRIDRYLARKYVLIS